MASIESLLVPQGQRGGKEKRRGDEDRQNSPSWLLLTSIFGKGLTQKDLVSFAENESKVYGIKLQRTAKRKKSILIKWFDEHFSQTRDMIARLNIAAASME